MIETLIITYIKRPVILKAEKLTHVIEVGHVSNQALTSTTHHSSLFVEKNLSP